MKINPEQELRVIEQNRNEQNKPVLINPVLYPRYDEVYYNGLEWLDSLDNPET